LFAQDQTDNAQGRQGMPNCRFHQPLDKEAGLHHGE
jgi:hypothetical protein